MLFTDDTTIMLQAAVLLVNSAVTRTLWPPPSRGRAGLALGVFDYLEDRNTR